MGTRLLGQGLGRECGKQGERKCRRWSLCQVVVGPRERCRRLSWPTGQGMSGACFVQHRIGPEASDLKNMLLVSHPSSV